MWLALPFSLRWMGQGMAVCSLGGTHVLCCCLTPALPLWGPALVGGVSLGDDTVLPSGYRAENLRDQTEVSHRTVASLGPFRSGLCHQNAGGPPLSLDPRSGWFLLLPVGASFGQAACTLSSS